MLKKNSPFSDAAILQPEAQSGSEHPAARQGQANSKLIQRIISSNQELIHEQMMKIRELQKLNNEMELKLKTLEVKYETLVEFVTFQQKTQCNLALNHQNLAECPPETQQKQGKIDINELVEKIVELEQRLSAAKVELAVLSNELEATKFRHHHDESGKKSRKTSISEDSIDIAIRLFQTRTFQYNHETQSKVEDHNKKEVTAWNKIYEQFGTVESKWPRFKEKTQTLIKKFIPHELRATIWPICLENKLGVTSALYSQLVERREKGWVNEKVRGQIDKDIKRSFSAKTHREISSKTITDVVELLEVFHIYRPDVGYVQGMTYPALVLIPILGKVQAFTLLANLILGNSFLRRLFGMEGGALTVACRVFEGILGDQQPQVWEKLKGMSISGEMYLMEWLFSLFSRGLSLEGTLKFWDHLLYFEETAIFRLALGVLEQLGPIILEVSLEETLNLLREYAVNVQEGKLLESLASSKLTRQKIQKYFRKIDPSL